jgi:hypothetical protein
VWRNRAAQSWSRHLPLLILSILHIIVFTGASLLTGFLVTYGTDNIVLLRGQDTCYWWHDNSSTPDADSAVNSWAGQQPLIQDSQGYAEKCYDIETITDSNTEPCDSSFVSASIDYTVETNVLCPFPNSTFCRSSNEGTVMLSSELINSNTHLGLNVKEEDQINFRQYFTCSPLPDTVDTVYANNVTIIAFNGTAGQFSLTERYFRYSNNQANDSEAMLAVWLDSSAQNAYSLDAATWLSNSTDPYLQPSWSLNNGLMPDIADITVITITNAVTYTSSFNDTLFGTEGCEPNVGCSGRTFSALACTQQYEFCNPVNGLCTRKGGWWDIGYVDQEDLRFRLWNDDGLTPIQHATIYNIQRASNFSQLPYLLNGLQTDALYASRQLRRPNSRLSGPLADNQTVQEYKYWFSMSLAALQKSFVQLALTPATDDVKVQVQNSSLVDLCQRQRVRNADYTSISVLGLAIILAVGGVITIISLLLPSLTAEIQRRFDFNPYLRNEWKANEIFHMQSKLALCFNNQKLTCVAGSAFEARGIGTWSRKESFIPRTMPYEKFQLPLSRAKAASTSQSTYEITRNLGSSRYTAVPKSENDAINGVAQSPAADGALEPLMHRDDSPSLWPRSVVHRRGESV